MRPQRRRLRKGCSPADGQAWCGPCFNEAAGVRLRKGCAPNREPLLNLMLLHWYLQSAMWGRYSGSTETKIDEDLKALDPLDDAPDRLIAILARTRGRYLEVPAADFDGSTVGA